MKKTLLLFILFFALHSAQASDTLSIRDVFNFNIGDTFNYRQLQGDIYPYYHYSSIDWTDIIVSKNVSPNNDTIRYIISRNGTIITSIITEPDSTVINYSDMPASGQHCSQTFTMDTSVSGVSNTVRWSCSFNDASYKYMQGLGVVYKVESGDMNMGGTLTALISYSRNGNRDTTAYIRLATNEPEDKSPAISLYPNPTNEWAHLSLANAKNIKTTLIMIDLLGQQVYLSKISEIQTTHDISNLPSGMYTWRLTSYNAVLKSGKIVKN